MQKGFSLLELIIVILVVAIIAAYAVPKFIDMSSVAKQKVTDSVASALNTASAVNDSLNDAGSSKAIPVDNCTDIADALPDGAKLPSGYSITSQAISAGSTATCTVTNPDNVTTATFIGRGVS